AGEPVRYHRVEELVVPHADAEAGLLEEVRRAAHALHAAGDDGVRLPELDRLRRQHDRLEARAARLVDGEAPDLLRDARLERRDAPGVEPEAGGEHVTEDHLLHLPGPEGGPPHGIPHGDRAELRGRELCERAAERADGGAGRADDDWTGHGMLLSSRAGRRHAPAALSL